MVEEFDFTVKPATGKRKTSPPLRMWFACNEGFASLMTVKNPYK